jgi:sulfur dioxygenase
MSTPVLFRQLFDQGSGTWSYLIADPLSREAVFIDPVYEQHGRDLALLRELELELVACLDTHCHADHVTGAWLLREATGCQLMAAAAAGIEGLDRALRQGDLINFGWRSLEVLETPGHTDGCLSFVLDERTLVFTGDSLLIRGCGRTDFQSGSASRLYRSIRQQLFTLPDYCQIYPAHDYNGRTSSSIWEEKRHNPRIGGAANEQDFVGYMENLRLPHPKQLDIAVPANLQCGRPATGLPPAQPAWAPLHSTYSGVQEVGPQWVAAHLDTVCVLDVRSRSETEEEGIRVAGALMIPVQELRERLAEVPVDRPVLTLCRSGRRSVLAFNILREAGWVQVANVQGGLLRWNEEGLPLGL